MKGIGIPLDQCGLYEMDLTEYVLFYSDKHYVKDLDKASSSLGR